MNWGHMIIAEREKPEQARLYYEGLQMNYESFSRKKW